MAVFAVEIDRGGRRLVIVLEAPSADAVAYGKKSMLRLTKEVTKDNALLIKGVLL